MLAFSIESYGAARADARLERSYLAALRTELVANVDFIQRGIESSEERLAKGQLYLRTVVMASSSEGVGREDVERMQWELNPFRTVAYQRGALDDILSSGGLELLRSDEIRREILTYARLTEQEVDRQQDALHFWEDHMGPYYYQHSSFSDFFEREIGGYEIPRMDADVDLGAFVGSLRYSNLVLERMVRDEQVLTARRELATQVQSLLTILVTR